MPPRLYIQPLVLSAPPLTSQTTHLISAFTSLTLRPQPHHPLQNPLCQPQSQRHASILASLSDTPGAYNRRIRRGRGASSGKGKTSGRGHKGQKQHGKVPFRSHLGRFNGGQTPVEWVHSKRGFENNFSLEMTPLNLDKLQSWIDAGRIDPTYPITVRELALSRCVSGIKDGVKLLAKNATSFSTPVHITVSRASGAAIDAIEKAGGSVQTRYYTHESIKRILRGETHPTLSMLSLPPPPTSVEGAGVTADAAVLAEVGEMATQTQTQTPLSQPSALLAKYKYRLPDPTSRKDVEYYRDAAHRGYLSHQVQEGQGPSLFFKTPLEIAAGMARRKTTTGAAGGKGKTGADNRIW